MTWQGVALMLALGILLAAGLAGAWAMLLVRGSAAESARNAQRLRREDGGQEG